MFTVQIVQKMKIPNLVGAALLAVSTTIFTTIPAEALLIFSGHLNRGSGSTLFHLNGSDQLEVAQNFDLGRKVGSGLGFQLGSQPTDLVVSATFTPNESLGIDRGILEILFEGPEFYWGTGLLPDQWTANSVSPLTVERWNLNTAASGEAKLDQRFLWSINASKNWFNYSTYPSVMEALNPPAVTDNAEPVPEPMTLTGLALGLVGLLAARNKRRVKLG